MNGATGYSRLSVEDLLDLVEHKEYPADEGFWLAKELRQRIDQAAYWAKSVALLEAHDD